MANEVCCVCGAHISNGEFVYDIDDGDYLLCDNPDCLEAYMKQYKKTVTQYLDERQQALHERAMWWNSHD
jgi:hypothetical protein